MNNMYDLKESDFWGMCSPKQFTWISSGMF